jgi:hypothetical protein
MNSGMERARNQFKDNSTGHLRKNAFIFYGSEMNVLVYDPRNINRHSRLLFSGDDLSFPPYNPTAIESGDYVVWQIRCIS